MKVLLRKNVRALGKIGDVVEVRNGYARNYLVPQGLASSPTEANLKSVEAEKARYLEELAHQRVTLEERAAVLSGQEVTIAALANEEGHLYGSVGPAQIAAALTEEGQFVEASDIVLDAPIRQLDKYDVEVCFDEDIRATVHVWIVPVRDAGIEPDAPAGQSDAADAEPPAVSSDAVGTEPPAVSDAEETASAD